MFHKLVLLHIVILSVGCHTHEKCEVLKNSKITLFTGGDLKTVTIQNENQDLENAYRIEIKDQNIPTLCKGVFSNLPKLDSLIVDSSNVNKIDPGAFENLPAFRNLIITNNNITNIEKGVFGDLLIRKLNLSHNDISVIKPNSFENMINLEVLDLNSNDLKAFGSDWFKYTPKLYRLDFMYNNIEEIPENAFTNIIKDKQKKNDLELWFMYNSITSIHKKAFNKVGTIEALWLSDNSLSNIEVEVFAQVEEIQTLLLDNNEFTCFDDNFLKHLKVKKLNIDGNPLTCECLSKIKTWGKQNNIELDYLRIGLKCLLSKISQIKEIA